MSIESLIIVGLAVVLFIARLDLQAPHSMTGYLRGNDSHTNEDPRV
jgi:hypothetical protein